MNRYRKFLRRFAAGYGVLLLTTANAASVSFAEIDVILQQRCVMCHSGPAAPRGLQLDTLEGLLAGSSNGAVVIAGDMASSELIRRLRGESMPRMPMTGPPFLTDEEISLFEDWVAAGLPAGPEAAVQEVVAATAAGEFVTFDRVAPIFATRCAKCHSDGGLMGDPPEGYRLTSYESVMATADRARVIPGNPAASELWRRVLGQARPRMPFDGPPFLDDAELALIEQWILDGARNSAGEPAPTPVGAKVRLHGTLRGHWSLDGLPLNISAATRIRGKPGDGDRVRVRGRLQADGSIRVDRLKLR